MNINFPDNFPKITDEELMKPLYQFEKENDIKGVIIENVTLSLKKRINPIDIGIIILWIVVIIFGVHKLFFV